MNPISSSVRDCLKIARLLLAAIGLFCFVHQATAAPKRPNIVLIMADDLGAECLQSYGSTSYKTPHLDALAASGIRFETCYSTPLCSPTRVQLMTGRYGFRTGWTQLIGRGSGADDDRKEYFDFTKERTFGHMLREAGYATAMAGKWQLAEFQQHPDHVRQSGFDEYSCWMWLWDGKKTDRYWKPVIWQNGSKREDVADRYGEDVFVEFLVDFMRRHREKPFFVYYPMTLVHDPFLPTPDSDAAINKMKNAPKNFADMVAYMDKVVGRLASALDELKLRENTLILFTGDNGTPKQITSRVGDLEIRGGKGQVAHVGSHVPLIANWKGTAPAGKVCTDLVDLSDVFPTLAELAGVELPRRPVIDGRSFAPQLRGQAGQPRDWIFSQLGNRRLAREQRYLLHDDGRLFDIPNDPLETKDLGDSADPEIVAAKKRLQAALDRLKPTR